MTHKMFKTSLNALLALGLLFGNVQAEENENPGDVHQEENLSEGQDEENNEVNSAEDEGENQDQGAQVSPVGNDSDLTMENHSLTWTSASASYVINENGLVVTPSNNNEASATALLTYSCGGNESIPAGNAEIRLPAYIFKDRSGNPTGTIELSIPKAPLTGGVTSFHYYVDDHGTEDRSDDEIVIVNYKEISEGGFFMKSDVVYKWDVVEVANEYSNTDIKASFKTTGSNGGASLEEVSETLSVGVKTKPVLNSGSKEQKAKYESWNAEWGTKPADADSYFYVRWDVTQSVSTLSTTAPFDLYIRESTENLGGGEIVTFKDTCRGKSGAYKPFDETKSAQERLDEMNATPVCTAENRTEVNRSGLNTREIIVRYPKSMADGSELILNNKADAEAISKDGVSSGVVHTDATYKYVYVGTDVPYGEDEFNTYKSYAATRIGNYSDRETTFRAALNMLKNGTSLEMSFGLYVKQMGYNRTDKGTEEYTTVLRDGMMYLNGQRLKDEDYDLTGFSVNIFNAYMPVFDANAGTSLEAGTDFSAYEPIVVYTRGSDGDWSEHGKLTRIASDRVRFDGADGSSSEHNLKNSSNVDARIALPEGTKDVKFTYETSGYGVEMHMGLFYKLHASEHVLDLIRNETKLQLFNISEAWGEKNGVLYTNGNTLTNNSFGNIKADVESSDQKEFGTGSSAILHDYASHVLTEEKGTGNFSKTLGTPVNDINKATVKIPVTLIWDYYMNYKNLGVTLEEAIDAKIINEAKEAYFYDLLPIGTTIDLSSIKVKPYPTTNLDGQKLERCEYSVELVNDWRGSGRTMVIINAKVPEDYRNFDKSSTYANTGFKVYFDMYDSWDNIAINGKTLVNEAGLYTMEGAVPGGVSDTGEGANCRSKELFENLKPAGDLGLENNVRYTNQSKTLSVSTSAQIGFSKSVKGAGDVAFSTEGTKVPATGAYSYQMRFSLKKNSSADSVVLYDILETAQQSNPNWMGVFKSVDVSQIRIQYPDVDVKVYYSTAKNIPDLQGPDASSVLDVSNTAYWSSVEPADLSLVTAVAVDLSKDKYGNTYTFNGEMALAALIHMEAVKEYMPYVDDPSTTVDETVYAYNRSYIAQGGQKVEGSNTVLTQVEKPKASIVKSSSPYSGTEASPTVVEYGSVLTYTLDVSNQNKADSMRQMTVEDVIPEGLEILEDEIQYWFGSFVGSKTTVGADKRVQADVVGQKITFTIDNLMANETVHLSIPVRVGANARGEAKYENTAKITGFNGGDFEYTSNTTYHIGKPVKFDLTVEKKWKDNNNQYGMRTSVKADVYRVDGTTKTLLETVVLSNANGFTDTVANLLRYQEDGVTEIQYEVEERPVAGYTAAYVYDKDTDTCTITNTAVVEKQQAEVQFTVTKYKEGTLETVPGVTFTLKDHNGKVSTQTTDANGVVQFSYKPASTRTTVDLNLFEDSAPLGYTKRTDPVKLTLTRSTDPTYTIVNDKIVENYGWTITTDMENRNGTYVLNNAYKALPVTVSFTLSKQMNSDVARPENKTFTFLVTPVTASYPMPNQSAYEIEITPADGQNVKTTTGSITFTEPGTYTYTITEVNDSTVTHPEYGYSYALSENGMSSSYTYTVTIKDEQGQLVVEKETLNGTEVQGVTAGFVNNFKYKKVDVTLVMEKGFTADSHDRPAERDFTFQVEPQNGAPLPKDATGALIDTVVVHGAGTSHLPTMTFETPGVYTYLVHEINDATTGYTFDQTEYEVKITVQATGTGSAELKAAAVEYRKTKDYDGNPISEAAQGIRVDNTYIPEPVNFTLPLKKVVEETTGSPAPTEAFVFTLESVGTAPMPNDPTVTITGAGEAQFALQFTRAGTYTYLIRETAGTLHGYTYDAHVYKVVVKVEDNNGQLETTWTVDGIGATADTKLEFTNRYTPDPVGFTLPVQKTLSGHATASNKTFRFKITAENNGPLPEEDTISIVGAGTASFEEIQFTRAGTYRYKVQEVAGSDLGYQYDTKVYDVEIVVTDVNGVLSAVWTANNGSLTFNNTYQPSSASVQLELTKQFTSDSADRPAEKDLKFTLSTSNNAPLPRNTQLTLTPAAGANTVTASGRFDAITFTETGTYVYTITEDLTGLNGYSSDNPETTVTVVVTDNDGQLEASLQMAQGGSVIVNRYMPTPVKKELNIQLSFTTDSHDRPLPKDFSFTAVPSGDGPKFENPSVDLHFNGGDYTEKHTGSFGNVTFTHAGTYTYTITQENKNYTGYGFDLTEQTLTVVVEDHDGTLVITSWNIGGQTSDTVQMANSYKASQVSFALPVEKIVRGSTRRDPFSFTLTQVNGSPMPREARVYVQGAMKTEFEEITFDQAGKYEYTLQEDRGSAPCAYDQSVRNLVIQVVDVDGQLEAKLLENGQPLDCVQFTNVYPHTSSTTGTSLQGPWTPNTGYSLVNTGVK